MKFQSVEALQQVVNVVNEAAAAVSDLLSNYIRDRFDKIFPPEEMEKIANSKASKVPFDAQDNRHTTEYVTGISAYYHRLLSL